MRPLSVFTLGYSILHTTNNNGRRPFYLGSLTAYSTTESICVTPSFRSSVLDSHKIVVSGNTKDGNTIFSFRDDSVSIGSITVGAGLTGQFALDNINSIVVVGSLICVETNTSGSTVGSITANGIFWLSAR